MYEPRPLIFPPNGKRDPELQQLADYLQSELRSIRTSLQIGVERVRFNPLHKEPEKPSAGDLVFAASDWDADGFGSGSGFYYRNEANTAWVLLN